MASVNVSDKDKAVIIEAYHKRPYLWTKADPGYSDKDLCDRARKEIGKMVTPEITGEQVKSVWSYLRNYRQKLNKKPRSGDEGGAQARGKKTKWPYYEMLGFLDTVSEQRETSGNGPDEPEMNTSAVEETGADADPATPQSQVDGDGEVANAEPDAQAVSEGTADARTVTPGGRLQRGSGAFGAKRAIGNARVTGPAPKKEKVDETDRMLIERLDRAADERKNEDVQFGMTIAMELKALRPATKIRTKMQIRQILGNAQLADLEASDNHAGTSGFQSVGSSPLLTAGVSNSATAAVMYGMGGAPPGQPLMTFNYTESGMNGTVPDASQGQSTSAYGHREVSPSDY